MSRNRPMRPKLLHVRHSALLVLALLLGSCATAPAPQLAKDGGLVHLEGLLDRPVDLRAADLALHAEHQQQAAFDSHEGRQAHRYQGASLFVLLDARGIQSEPQKFGGLLDRYLLATGADGYQVVFSMAEISPGVGGNDSLVATRLDGDASGQAVLYSTSPNDARGGRYVANLASLAVRAPAPALDSSQLVPGSVQVLGTVRKPITLDAARLSSIAPGVQNSSTADLVGVSLWMLLNQAGLQFDSGLKNPLLSMFVVAQGQDGYRAIFSMAELSPDFGNKPVLLVVSPGQSANGAAAPDEIRLTVPDDANHSRWVHHLVSLTVESARPEGPAALAR